MLEIELNTFLIVVELLMAIYALTAFLVYLVRRQIMHLTMGLSFVVSFIAFVLMRRHINDPEPSVVVIYNFLFLLSVVLIIGGFRAYYKLKPIPLRYSLLLIISLLTTFFFLTVVPSYLGRVTVSSLSLIMFLLDTLHEAGPAIKAEHRIVRRTVYSSMGALMFFFIVRLLNVLLFFRGEIGIEEGMRTTALVTGLFSVITYNFWIIGSMLLESSRTFMNLSAENVKMESLAMLDPLLKIYNRNKLNEDLAAIVENGNRMGDTASILLIDLDKFKSINDEYGHDVGDEVLIQATQIITSLLRADDSVYRWGGDEFMILAPLTDIDGAARLAERINNKFETSVFPKVGELHVSIGCAQHFRHELKENWFKRVDLTLYKAKQSGRNRIECWANTDLLPATIAKLTWQGIFESGDGEIDNQHKTLLRLSNELYDRLGSSDSMADVDEILDRVGTELKDHFNYEYDLIKELNFNEADEHKVIHDELLSEYEQMRTQLHEGKVNLGAFFNFVSVKIIAEHIIKEDSKFFELIKSNQS